MNSFEVIQDKQREFQPLFSRMDKDRDLYNAIEFKLLGAKDLPLKDVVNVTMNDAKVFAERAMSFMAEANMQTVVAGKHLKDSETTIIEDFDEDVRYEIDQLMMPREIQSLYNFLIEQVCIRGKLGARFIAFEDKEKFVPDLMPCDSRYLLYEYGDKDLEWAAYPSVQTKATILGKYPQAEIADKKAKVWDFWDKEKNEIWIGTQGDLGQLLKTEENKLGYVPYIIEGVGAGSMLADEDAIAYHHESIFSSTRLLYKHINMLASILQTLNFWTFAGPAGWESDAGTEGIPPKDWRGTQKTVSVDKGTRGLFPFEISDVKNATRIFYALLMGAIQRGSLPNVDYGNLTFPLSAVAISRLTATKDAIFAPRLQAIAFFYRKLHYMIKDQYIKGQYTAELGEEGMQRTYKPSDLDKKYALKYQFYATSPEQEIANLAKAREALAIGISRHTVFTEILKFKNPKGEMMKADAEEVRKLDPVIALYDYGHALIDQQEYFKADLVKDKIKQLIKARYMGMPEEPTPTGKPSAQSMIPLMEGGGGGGRPMTSELEMPEESLQAEERRTETVRKQEQEG